MFLVIPVDNWSIIYKLILLVTMVFHPKLAFREFAFWFSLSLLITGYIKENFLVGGDWFLMQIIHELFTLLLAGRLLKFDVYVKFVLTIQAIGFLLLNIYQFQTLTSWFMSPDDYIWWNMLGFELIIISLWFREEVLHSIKKRWTLENLTMVYIMGWAVYFIGNY